MKTNNDVSVVTIAGTKKRFEKTIKGANNVAKGLLYVAVDILSLDKVEQQVYRFDIWDETQFERIEKIPNGAMVRVNAKPSNYNYERDGSTVYSYDLTLINISPYSGKQYTQFAIRGRLVEDVVLGTASGKPYMVLKLASNTGKKPVFIHLRHYGYNANILNIGYKGNTIALEGYVRRKIEDGTFQFFATSVWSENVNDEFASEPILE